MQKNSEKKEDRHIGATRDGRDGASGERLKTQERELSYRLALQQ